MSKLVKILSGEHAGTIAHVTGQAPQYGGVNVTPIYGDPLVSIYLRRHQVERVTGTWRCPVCGAEGPTVSSVHCGCANKAIFLKDGEPKI